MSVEAVAEVEDRSKYAGVLRFYDLAKHQEWAVRDVPWDDLPPVPEGKGSPERQARRRDVPRFRRIARSSRGTILEDLCNRLAIDDGIHHGAGMAYERVLLEHASDRTKGTLIEAANRMLPEFAKHALWRPKAREMIGH